MSTEARHASIPPRPTTPPRPTEPPTTGTEPTGPARTPAAPEDHAPASTPGRPPVPPMPTTRPTPGPTPDGTDADGDGQPRGSRVPPAREGFPGRAAPAGDMGGSLRRGAPTGDAGGGAPRRGGPVDPARDPAGSPRPGGPAEAARDATSRNLPPGFPRLRVPPPADPAPADPGPQTPPRVSARFPDAAPSAPEDARRDRTVPRRDGSAPGTSAETAFRPRPYAPEPDAPRTTSTPQSRPTPPRPSGGPTTPPARPMPPATPPRPSSAPADRPATPQGRPAPPRPSSAPAGSFGRGAPAVGEPSSRQPDPALSGRGASAVGGPSSRQPDPALSWNAPPAPRDPQGGGRPVVSFGEPEGYDERARPRMLGGRRLRAAGVAACLVLGLGLIGGAVTGSWLVGDSAAAGTDSTFAAAGGMWHSVPVDRLFPPTLEGQGAGPGGADRTWTRIAVAPDSGCANAFDPLLRKALAPVGCQRLLRATYTDATQSHVTTVGLLFTKADAAGMTALGTRFDKEGLGRRADLMPRPYAAKDTVAADFGTKQRASWAISVLTDAPVVVYAVSGWADGREVDEPQPAEEVMRPDADSDIAQAGLGHEAQGLADRVERGLRKTVSSATEQPS
ncbi:MULTISPECIES: hypothetical protein [unclassified Streptomyces]|uniref:hypothetical protein n=1 Tax=unclassified Streptomyces TaxID=2593676 RepID=UPI0036E0F9A1